MMSDFRSEKKDAAAKNKKAANDSDSDIVDRAFDEYIEELGEMTAESELELYLDDWRTLLNFYNQNHYFQI